MMKLKQFLTVIGFTLSATFCPSAAAQQFDAPAIIIQQAPPGETQQVERLYDRLGQVDRALLTKLIANAAEKQGRIVGGLPVMIADFPWQVALIRGAQAPGSRAQFCGGSLIAANVVVTAAHCVDNAIVRSNAQRVHIVAGTTSYAQGGERLEVSNIFIHPQWNSNTMDFDVAVLQLKQPSTLGTPVSLGTQPVTVGDAWVSGWGATTENGQGSPNLLAAKLPLVQDSVCAESQSYGHDFLPSMLCAGLKEGGIDSCQGDSGGPLVMGTGQSEQLVGVVSWGEGCARRLKYGIYTRVSVVSDWIATVAGPSQVKVLQLPEGLRSVSTK